MAAKRPIFLGFFRIFAFFHGFNALKNNNFKYLLFDMSRKLRLRTSHDFDIRAALGNFNLPPHDFD